GVPDRDHPGLRGLPEVRRVPARADDHDGAGTLRVPPRGGGGQVGGHQHHSGRRLPRRGPARGHRGGGAGDGPVRGRDRRRPGAEEGGPSENATVEVHPDGSATILTGTSPHGQGHSTAWAMLASDELGIPVDKITLRWGDTDLIPEGGGTGGSRSLQQGGAAVQQASQELLEVARQRAADTLEASPAD